MIIEELKQLEDESKSRGIPIIGHEKGIWILQKIKRIQPQEILELGTANGYSGIILASEGGHLTTIEIDELMAKEAEQNYEDFMVNADIIVGDAVEEIKKLTENSFDLIFIDFAKKKYIEVLKDCLKLVKIGGHIIADNITMEGCEDFKDKITIDNRLLTEFIPIKDGMSISKRIS